MRPVVACLAVGLIALALPRPSEAKSPPITITGPDPYYDSVFLSYPPEG